jgi:AcrR family transcriptional regulator
LIERETAVRTALELIDREGLAAFSIEKLGRELGVKGPSLYHHFTDRADLLAHVARLILLEVDDAWQGDDPAWDEGLESMALGLRRAILKHPNAGPVLLAYFPRPMMTGAYKHVLGALTGAGFDRDRQIVIVEGVEKLTLGWALYRAADGVPTFKKNSARSDEALFLATLRAFLAGAASGG